MRGLLVSTVLLGLLLAGCGAAGTAASGDPAPGAETETVLAPGTPGGGANAFNPYMHDRLPNTRLMSAEASQMLGKMGAHTQSIEGEAAYRGHWRQELYPVVFGDPKAPHEVLVLLDFSAPQSEKVWHAVVEASRSLSSKQRPRPRCSGCARPSCRASAKLRRTLGGCWAGGHAYTG
ncbi:MAG: hypothetical protein U0M13_08925, partial [Desulfovibrio fairfieldensis]|nr:hypothetical protein [Desulfovibrio fairfieldensis]